MSATQWVIAFVLAWCALAVVAGIIVGRFIAYGNTDQRLDPIDDPVDEPTQAPVMTAAHAHVHYQCDICGHHTCEVVTTPDRTLNLIAAMQCPSCTNTLANHEQEMTQ